MKVLGDSHTAYDVMREYMIIGAELDGKYQIPMLDRYTGHPGEDTIDFKDSFSLKIKNHRKLTVNFYIHDYEFEKIWNNPDRYLEHLKCFHSVIGPDFSMAVGENGMPFAMNIYQKYRNHALSHYLSMNGIKVDQFLSMIRNADLDMVKDGIVEEDEEPQYYLDMMDEYFGSDIGKNNNMDCDYHIWLFFTEKTQNILYNRVKQKREE